MSLPFAVLVILLAPNVASTGSPIGSIRLSEGEICVNSLHEPTPEARLMLVFLFGLRMQSLHKEARWWSESAYKAQLCLAAYSPKWCTPVPYQEHESAQDVAESALVTYEVNITQVSEATHRK
ncbi:unnamed protein product [Cylicocyclus nassatus]|uniref:Uncharacterized protein n=1 Tax=Cylicocyclus nassatus TaxID=53992 RepID=A0AA36GH25_CYLNA|nr:unnamed protein product [Cylicocyclus nassatus]